MKRLMMTVAAIALTTPAFAQDAATTEAPAGTMQTAPADSTTAPANGTATTEMQPMATDDAAVAGQDQTGMTGQDQMGMTGQDQTGMTGQYEHGRDQAAELSAQNPGITGSWLMDRSLYTTNEPSSTQWSGTTGDTRPDNWSDIGNVSDLVMTTDGQLVGYIVDIGGFLGLGTHTVMLERGMLNIAQFGNDVVLATNYSQEELEALPEFDDSNVMN